LQPKLLNIIPINITKVFLERNNTPITNTTRTTVKTIRQTDNKKIPANPQSGNCSLDAKAQSVKLTRWSAEPSIHNLCI
jgi:hypothetical protein